MGVGAAIRLHIGVMHDRRREALLPTLLGRLDAIPARRLKDRAGVDGWLWGASSAGSHGTLLVADGTMAGPWTAMRDAILMASLTRPEPTHLLLLEDDAEPVDGFGPAVLRAVASRPDDALYFFATKTQAGAEMDAAAARGEPFAPVMARTVGTLAVALPMPMATAFMRAASDPEWDFDYRKRFPCSPHAGDSRLWMWLEQSGMAQWVSVWSLVEHGRPAYADSISGADRPRAITDEDAADQAARRRAYRPRDWDVGELF